MPKKATAKPPQAKEEEQEKPTTKDRNKELWERFTSVVTQCGRSTYRLAKDAGLPIATLQDYKPTRKQRSVPAYLIAAVADVLEWSPENVWWILSGEGEPPPMAKSTEDD